MRSLIFCLLVVGAVAVAASATRAATPTDSGARDHFKRGTTLYDLGNYAEAATEYEKAYRLKDDPALLFNIGQSYRFAGDLQRALVAYRSYIRRNPNASNRSSVQTQIAKLQAQLDEQRAAPTEASPPPTPVPTPVVVAPAVPVAVAVAASPLPPIRQRRWFWPVVIVPVVVVVAVGVGLGVGLTLSARVPEPQRPVGTFNVVF